MTHSPQNFLIVGAQRTGSSALAEMLDTHPQIAVGWEWTERAPWLKKINWLADYLAGRFDTLRPEARSQIEASMSDETRWLGFRRLFGASDRWLLHPRYSAKLALDRFAAHQRWLRAHPEVRLVHIVRNDHVSWLKSKYVARAADNFVGGTHPEDLRVTVPLKPAVARVRAKLWLDAELAALASSNPYLRVDYEDFSARLPELVADVAQFLDCPREGIAPEATKIRKQSDRPDADYIENYAELTGAIAGLEAEPGAS